MPLCSDCTNHVTMSLKNAAITGGFWYATATATTALADLIIIAVLSRILSPSDFGVMAMVMLVLGFAAAYNDMGLSSAVIQRKYITREQFSSVYWLTVFCNLMLCAGISAATPLLAFFFKEPLLGGLLPVASTCLVLIAIGQPFDWILEKELRFETLAKMDIAKALVGLFISIAGALCGMGVWALVWGYLCRWGVGTVWLLILGLPKWRPLFRFHPKELHGFVRFGLFQLGERTLLNFNYRIDQLLVGTLLGTQQLGYYNFAVNSLLVPVCSLSSILLRIALPVFSQVQNDQSILRHHYLKMMRLINTLNAPLLFGLAALAPLLVPMVFGSQWAPAIPIVQLLSFYMFCRNAGDALGPLLLVKGEVGLSFRWNLFMFLITTPFIVAGAKLGGTIGVAAALTLVMALRLPANYFYLMRPMLGPSGMPFASCIIKPALMSLTVAVGLWFVSASFSPSSTAILIEMCAGITLYLYLEWYFDRSHFVEVKELLNGALRSARKQQPYCNQVTNKSSGNG